MRSCLRVIFVVLELLSRLCSPLVKVAEMSSSSVPCPKAGRQQAQINNASSSRFLMTNDLLYAHIRTIESDFFRRRPRSIDELKMEALAAIRAETCAADDGDDGNAEVGAADSHVTPARDVQVCDDRHPATADIFGDGELA